MLRILPAILLAWGPVVVVPAHSPVKPPLLVAAFAAAPVQFVNDGICCARQVAQTMTAVRNINRQTFRLIALLLFSDIPNRSG
jgi:hypothetical protein